MSAVTTNAIRALSRLSGRSLGKQAEVTTRATLYHRRRSMTTPGLHPNLEGGSRSLEAISAVQHWGPYIPSHRLNDVTRRGG